MVFHWTVQTPLNPFNGQATFFFANNMTSNKSTILFTDSEISAPPISLVKIYPLVVFTIADSYERSLSSKPDTKGEDRNSIGVLYGEYNDSDAIVYDACACLASEDGVVKEDLRIKTIQEHNYLYPNEKVLGYFTFGKKQVEWPSLIQKDAPSIHLSMKPSNPPKIEVFSVVKTTDDRLVYTPIEYVIEASPEEQLGLSRLAASSSKGSLQAAINELINLLNLMKNVCEDAKKDKLIGRQIQSALDKINLKDTSKAALTKAAHDIKTFLDVLQGADKCTREVENYLSLPIDDAN